MKYKPLDRVFVIALMLVILLGCYSAFTVVRELSSQRIQTIKDLNEETEVLAKRICEVQGEAYVKKYLTTGFKVVQCEKTTHKFYD